MKKIWNKNTKIVFLIIVAAALWYFVSFTATFFWTIFLSFAIFGLDSTIVAQAALVCLVMLPILLATGKDGVAEQVAVYAYFLLAITVGLQIIELKRHPGEEEHDKNTDDSLQSKDTSKLKLESDHPLIPMIRVKIKETVIDMMPKQKRTKRKISSDEIKSYE